MNDMGKDTSQIEIVGGEKRKRFPYLRKLGRKALHLILTFILGVALATAYHQISTSKNVRKAAENICNAFSRDADECKDGIDNVLDMSDDEVQNNININGGEK